MTATYRGSRKHVLDWVSKPTFLPEFLALADAAEARVTRTSRWMPLSYRSPEEARLDEFGPAWLPDHPVWDEIRHWWLLHHQYANTPNWDIALGCEIEGKPGLVLVEAKAHESELDSRPKEPPNPKSTNSQDNHRQISQAIEQARTALCARGYEVGISRDKHYQLSNRLAFLWKLACAGIPTVLIYLGFTGDQEFGKGVTPFRDHDHWAQTFVSYAEEVMPRSIIDLRLDFAPVPAWFLLRSRPVLEASTWG